VGFQVIPAVDVSGGRLARAGPSGIVRVEAFAGDPAEAARAFVAAGASWVHVVDLELALTGVAANLGVVRAIAELGVGVQASGGVSSAAEVEAALEAGASRVVLGSAALADRDAIGALIARFGTSLVVGIETDGRRIRPRRRGSEELPLWGTVEWLSRLPVARFLHTALDRVGRLEGPDVDGVLALARSTGRPVLASGGIRGIDDLVSLAALGGAVEGAVVGRALYEGLDLRDVLAAVG
jgi:phosphoribosylformimino-5-aminoimidazole carboxamide ribonucleotide (ProFAR) isomerase